MDGVIIKELETCSKPTRNYYVRPTPGSYVVGISEEPSRAEQFLKTGLLGINNSLTCQVALGCISIPVSSVDIQQDESPESTLRYMEVTHLCGGDHKGGEATLSFHAKVQRY